MASYRNLARRCADCPSPATMAVFTERSVLVGEYCNACGEMRLAGLNRDEKAALEWQKTPGVTSNG